MFQIENYLWKIIPRHQRQYILFCLLDLLWQNVCKLQHFIINLKPHHESHVFVFPYACVTLCLSYQQVCYCPPCSQLQWCYFEVEAVKAAQWPSWGGCQVAPPSKKLKNTHRDTLLYTMHKWRQRQLNQFVISREK